jgi:hypothetical protein
MRKLIQDTPAAAFQIALPILDRLLTGLSARYFYNPAMNTAA